MQASARLAQIGYTSQGNGPPLVLLHGIGASAVSWGSLLPHLSARYTVICADRPGRGMSEDLPGYTLEAEVGRLAEFVDAMDEPVRLFGHSFGGFCALEALLRTSRATGAVVYEPSVPGSTSVLAASLAAEIRDCLGRKDNDAALAVFLRGLLGLTEREVDLMRGLPGWAERTAQVPLIVRELQALATAPSPLERWSKIDRPVRLVHGELSAPGFIEATRTLCEAIPGSRLRVLQKQGHLAMSLAPRRLAEAIIAGLDWPTG